MKKFEKIGLAVAMMFAFLVPTLASSSAHAICDADRTIYEFKAVKGTERLTNVRGDWMEAGFRAAYNDTTTATVNASMTATVSAEAGIVFAKASASIGMTVGASWSKAKSWTYTGPEVPRGKEGRVVMYRESRKFTVVKKSLRSPCTYVTVYSASVEAPTIFGTNIWRMQYRAARARSVMGRDFRPADSFEQEVDLAVEEDEGIDPNGGFPAPDDTDELESPELSFGSDLLNDLVHLAAAGLEKSRRLLTFTV